MALIVSGVIKVLIYVLRQSEHTHNHTHNHTCIHVLHEPKATLSLFSGIHTQLLAPTQRINGRSADSKVKG